MLGESRTWSLMNCQSSLTSYCWTVCYVGGRASVMPVNLLDSANRPDTPSASVPGEPSISRPDTPAAVLGEPPVGRSDTPTAIL